MTDLTDKLPSWIARAVILASLTGATIWLGTLHYWGPVIMGAGTALCMVIALPPWQT